MSVEIRKAEEKDTHLILDFINSLAEYEGMANEVTATEKGLMEQLFTKNAANVIFSVDAKTGKETGFALYFRNFSTFLGKSGIYLEDLFVSPEHRGKGHGKALLRELAEIAKSEGCGRLEWSCLDWNKPSIDFYKSLGAVPMDEWTVYRVTSDKFDGFASEDMD